MSKPFRDTKAFQVVTTMPRVVHWDGIKPFDPAKSQLVSWVMAQPDTADYVKTNKIRLQDIVAVFKRALSCDQTTTPKTWAGNPQALIRRRRKLSHKQLESQFEAQYSEDALIENLKLEPAGLETEILKGFCIVDSNMSAATFFRLLRKLVASGKIEKREKKWFLITKFRKLIPKSTLMKP